MSESSELADPNIAASPRVGEGFETSFEHTWGGPPWVTLLAVIILSALVIAIYLRERGDASRVRRGILIGLRLTLVGLVLAMLYGWMRHEHRTDLPDLVVMVDGSSSMATVDPAVEGGQGRALAERVRAAGWGEPSRLHLAQTLLLEGEQGLLTQLSQAYRIKSFLVGDALRAQELAPPTWRESLATWDSVDANSRLGDNLLEVLQMQRGRPTAAVVFLTDGVTTEGRSVSEAAALARRRNIPLYLVGLGSDRPPRDIRLTDLAADDVAFVNDLLVFQARFVSNGYEGSTVRVRLVRVDTGTVLAEQRVTVGADGESAPVRLATRPRERGEFEFAVVAETLAGEVTESNNRLAKLVTVSEETLRVLLVQAYPNYDFRFLKTLLQRQLKSDGGDEKAIALSTLLQESDADYASQDETAIRTFPATREELYQYDVVIFGDVNPSLLGGSALTLLADYVKERGGGLIVLAGPRFTPLAYRDTPLADLLPVSLETAAVPAVDESLTTPFRARVTPLGTAAPPLQIEDTSERNQQAWEQLPGWYWMLAAPDLRPGARVLAEHPDRTTSIGQNLPLILLQFIGAGKVMMHTSDDSWRWSREAAGEAHYSRYWLQWLRYLSRSRLAGGNRLASLTADREEYQRGDSVRLRVRFHDERQSPEADDGTTVVVQRDGGGPRTVTLQRELAQRAVFEGSVNQLPDGTYRAWLASPVLDGQPPAARFTVVAPAGEQSRLEMDSAELRAAAKASGGRFYTFGNASRLADDLPRGRQVRIESLPPQSVWNDWPWAALFVAAISLEWLLRKRAGML